MSSTSPILDTTHTGLPPPSSNELLDIHTGEPHIYNHPRLAAHPNIQPRCRILFFFNKKSGISDEKFHTWWEAIHADLTVSTEKFPVYIRRYAQLHSTPAQKKAAGVLIGPNAETLLETADGETGTKLLNFDACGEMVVDKLEDWVKFSSDPEFLRKLVPDADNFMGAPIHIFPSYENLIYGPAIPGSGGRDGLSEKNLKKD